MSRNLTQPQANAVADALASGQKIQAIKLYREYSGKGLAEAKDAVEAMESDLRKENPERFAQQQAQGKGCAAMLVALVAATVLVWVV